MIGPEIGSYVLHGSWSHQNPASETNWKQFNDNEIFSIPVSIKIISTAGKILRVWQLANYSDLNLILL